MTMPLVSPQESEAGLHMLVQAHGKAQALASASKATLNDKSECTADMGSLAHVGKQLT